MDGMDSIQPMAFRTKQSPFHCNSLKSISVFFTFVCANVVHLCFSPALNAQSSRCESVTRLLLPHKAVYSDADRRCTPGRRLTDTIAVDIPTGGFYKISFLARYSIKPGEEQINESFFVLARQQSSGLISYPIDANLSQSMVDSVDANGDSISYKIVLDDNSLTTKNALRNAGVFFLQKGAHVIEIHHYATIASRFPQFINVYPSTAFSDPCYEALSPPVISGHLGGKYNAESIELDSLAIEQVECQAYDISAQKVAGKDSVFTAGDTLSYTLSIANLGPGSALNITVADTLPPFASAFDIQPPPAKFEKNVLEWQVVFLANDSTAAFSYKTAVSVTPEDTTLALVNRSRAISALDTSASNDTAVATVIARPKPPAQKSYDLAFSKSTGQDTVFTKNDIFKYSLMVDNLGPNTAFNITVKDTLPLFVSTFDFSLPPSRTADNVVEWQVDSLGAGNSFAISFMARVNVSPPDSIAALVNRGHVSAPNDTLAANNSGQATVIAVPKPKIEHKYDLRLTKAASLDTVSSSDSSFVYSLIIINAGPLTAHQISLLDTLPPFVTASGFSHSPVRIENNLIEWQLDSLTANSAVQISFTATVHLAAMNAIMSLVNRGQVRAPNDTVAANNFAQVTVVALPGLANYDLAFTKTAGKDTVFTESDTVRYALTLRNAGPNEAEKVTVSDTLPPFVTAFDFSPQPSRIENNLLEWQMGPVATNSAVTISYSASITVTPADTTLALSNRGGVAAPNDTVAANNSSTATVIAIKRLPVFYALDISKIANADSVNSGESFSYTISVTNTGTGVIPNYTVRDHLPSQLGPNAISNYFPRPPDEISGNILSWTFGALAPATTQLIIFDVAGPALSAPGAAAVLNIAEAIGPNNIPVASSRDSTVVVFVARPAVECYLDRNVWKPGEEPPLGIHFSLTTGSTVRIKIHDLAGTLIRDLLDRFFGPGQHRVEWDGRTENGLQAGSGLYVVTFQSQQFIDWKKVIIVR
jgi:uncharacterized repeat protein (TIGR01451 family)